MEDGNPRPTSTETARSDRERIVTLSAHGWSRQAIAEEVGCSRRTVQRWMARFREGGLAALDYRSRRPHTPHPLTTASALVERIDAIRQAHPGWGARLIHRQLQLEAWEGIPSEVTVHAWLRRLGHCVTQRQRHKPLGWSTPPSLPSAAVWQMDFKEKGGTGT